MLGDLGCNAVRCWGGNVYESDRFFDFCDSHGIMVWQDFAMGCGVYPQDESFSKKLADEAVFQIKRLRNHPHWYCGQGIMSVIWLTASGQDIQKTRTTTN